MVCGHCRNVCRQVTGWFHEEDEELSAAFVRWTKVCPLVLAYYLRTSDEVGLPDDTWRYLTDSEISLLLLAPNKPLFVISMMSLLANQAELNSDQHVAIDNNLSSISEYVSQCERILSTPVPLSYTRCTQRFLFVWLLLLPACIWPEHGWLAVPMEIFVAVPLLGIDEVGHRLGSGVHHCTLDPDPIHSLALCHGFQVVADDAPARPSRIPVKYIKPVVLSAGGAAGGIAVSAHGFAVDDRGDGEEEEDDVLADLQ
ncbi:hypothetical protein CYMTET_42642 [Cymbomonas tetramitiformis]|uniref:Uncharacterized protein n=1 Tax=Cymbomonas tetramitiformis TaxID=36881 RepID=A0AAE0C5P8_9CHLO|nr:hypothetical protein CYMTET_42642 [Cymbomonas tetramitiformis]